MNTGTTSTQQEVVTNHVEEFLNVVRSAGLQPPDLIQPGRTYRFPGVGKSCGNTAGWCILFPDARGGRYGDWSTGFEETWQARNGHLPKAERDVLERSRAETRTKLAEEQKQERQAAAARAAELWNSATPASGTHPYLARKGVHTHNLRQRGEALLVPVYINGELSSLQFIDADGSKRFLSKGAVAGGVYVIGSLDGAETIVVAEGYATASSIYAATGFPVVIAFNCGNLERAATGVRGQLPEANIVIAADNDEHRKGEQAARAAATAVSGRVALPEAIGSDWNDVARELGLDAVREAFEAVLTKDPAQDTAALLDAIVGTLNRFVVLPPHAAETVALYVLFTHLAEKAQFAPMLVLTSPEMRCGKTTCLDLISELVHNPLGASNVSPAALFRAVEEFKPTLILDEVDAYMRQKNDTAEAIRGILNSGHRRGRQATVLRMVPKGNEYELRQFSTFCPKVVAGIGDLAPTLRDRSVILPLRRKLPDEDVERLRIVRIAGELEKLRQWASHTAEVIADGFGELMTEVPTELSDRAADNWEHLIAIADIAGADWPERARRASVALSVREGDVESAKVLLLADIRDYFTETGLSAVRTTDLLGHLNELETSPWSTWHRDKNMTARDLAKLVEPFGVKPHQLKVERSKVRGYRAEDFADAWRRYLSESGKTRDSGTETPISAHNEELNGTGMKSGTGTTRYSDSDIDEEHHQVPVLSDDTVPHKGRSEGELSKEVVEYRQNTGDEEEMLPDTYEEGELWEINLE